jgi:hypothetical protein
MEKCLVVFEADLNQVRARQSAPQASRSEFDLCACLLGAVEDVDQLCGVLDAISWNKFLEVCPQHE